MNRLEFAVNQRLRTRRSFKSGIYRRYGVTFSKISDGERVARQMTSEEIEPEIQDLLRRATSLAVREE